MAATWLSIALSFTVLASTECVVKGYKQCVKCTSLNVKTTCQDLIGSGYIETETGKYCPDAGFENELETEKSRLSNFASAFGTADNWRKFEQKIRRTLGKSRHWYHVKKHNSHETNYEVYLMYHLKPLIDYVQVSEERWASVVKSGYHWTKLKEVCRKLKLEYKKKNDVESQHYGKYKKILKLLQSVLPFSALRRRHYERDILAHLQKDRTRWLQTHLMQVNSSEKTTDNQIEKGYPDLQLIDHLPWVLGGIGIGCMLSVLIGVGVFRCIRCYTNMRSQNGDSSEEDDEEEAILQGDKKKMSARCGLFKKDMDETLTENDVKSIMETMKSVGVFRIKERAVGTVVRVGTNSILTAWHILERTVCPPGKINMDGKIDLEMHPENLRYIDVAFNGNSFGVLPQIPFYDKNLDICLLEVNVPEGKADSLPPPINLYRDFNTMKWFGTEPCCVHVIGLHPVTSDVVLDPGCKIISPDDKIVHKAKKWIYSNKMYIETNFQGNETINFDAAYADVLNTNTNLIINTYLEFGGSGGAVLAFTHDRKVALVAILLKGLPPWYWNMKQGCEFPKYLRMEVGCHIPSILGSPNWTVEYKKRIF